MSVRKPRGRIGARRASMMAQDALMEAYATCQCCKKCLRGVCDGSLLGLSCDRFCVCENPVDDSHNACEAITYGDENDQR